MVAAVQYLGGYDVGWEGGQFGQSIEEENLLFQEDNMEEGSPLNATQA